MGFLLGFFHQQFLQLYYFPIRWTQVICAHVCEASQQQRIRWKCPSSSFIYSRHLSLEEGADQM